MKKVFTIISILLIMLLAVSCGQEKAEEEKPVDYDIAMVTNTVTIEDGSFNQSVWEGIETFVNRHPTSYRYYQAMDERNEDYQRAIEEAVNGGAKIVIAVGDYFGEIVAEEQLKHKDVSFVLIDGVPRGADGEKKLEKSTTSVVFAEEQAGFLAGYAAVKEGYGKLGFVGGKSLNPVKRYESGFLQGADAAAAEQKEKIQVTVKYDGQFKASKEAERNAAQWYKDGTEVIFACGGEMGLSVMNAAEDNGGAIIGVDCDQSALSETVITSAVKEMDTAVADILEKYYEDKFPGGKVQTYNVKNQGVGLPMESSKFKHFTNEDYEKVYERIKTGKQKVKATVRDTQLNNTTITRK